MTAQQYNALVDKVNQIEALMFVQGYDLMSVSNISLSWLMRLFDIDEDAYVPLDEYEELAQRVWSLEELFSVPGAAFLQVGQENDEDSIVLTNIPYAEGDYVTEAEFDILRQHVEALEEWLSDEERSLFAVSVE